MIHLVHNYNELRSIRNTADIKQRVRNVLATRHPDAGLRHIKIITYEDIKNDERQYLVSSLSIDVIRERKPRGKKSRHMLRESYVTIINVVAEGLPNIVNDSVKRSFIKDVILYNKTFPRYSELQKSLQLRKKLLNVFPEYYKEDNIIDFKDAENVSLLIIEDVKTDGYITLEPTKEFDLKHTKCVLQRLAYFHAVGIALIRNDPNVFKADLKGINQSLYMFHSKIESDNINTIIKLLKDNKNLNRYLDKFINLNKNVENHFVNTQYTTLIHNNLCKENILLKYRMRKGYPTHPRFVKFKNFQFCTQGSLVLDLVQFMFACTVFSVKANFQTFSYIYLENLTKYLKYIKCSSDFVDKFTTASFREELKIFAWVKLKSIISLTLMNTEGLENDVIVSNVSDIFYFFDKYDWL